MKILALVAHPRMPNNDEMYQAMQQYAQVDVVKMDSSQQKNLRKQLKHIDLKQYDRIVLDLHFKRIVKQARFLSALPSLVIYEEDAWQNYIRESKWHGQFLPFYKKLGHFRLLCTSAQLAEKFKHEGIDACFLAKSYDQSLLKNLDADRDIELGFIGRISSDAYGKRKELLTFMQQTGGLQLLRTEPGEAYLNLLNRIKVFVSADLGFDEYMIKNFEAMACGCLLVAYRQGVEEEALGLEDMKNVVLYGDKQELLDKLELLKNNTILVGQIANAGQAYAEKYFTYDVMARNFYSYVENASPINLKNENKLVKNA